MPKMPWVLPNVTPQFVRFSSQFANAAQLAESPPKLKPIYGVMNPSARAGDADSDAISVARARI